MKGSQRGKHNKQAKNRERSVSRYHKRNQNWDRKSHTLDTESYKGFRGSYAGYE